MMIFYGQIGSLSYLLFEKIEVGKKRETRKNIIISEKVQGWKNKASGILKFKKISLFTSPHG